MIFLCRRPLAPYVYGQTNEWTYGPMASSASSSWFSFFSMFVGDNLDLSFFFSSVSVRMRILPTFCLGQLSRCSFYYNLRIRSQFMSLSDWLYDRCWQRSISISCNSDIRSHGNGWCFCGRNWYGSSQSKGLNESLFLLVEREGIATEMTGARERLVRPNPIVSVRSLCSF